ncbi:RluA family pseudouridine synthase [Anaerobacillus sp. MEB173]|uniref:RluA family pseudouridine synthase n=1 Tax=Anaerobacillus sp. MEB173 TaxID=3383345 RepID=UPI003F8FD69D
MISFTWNVNEAFAGQMLRYFLREEKQLSRQALTDIKFRGGSIFVNDQPVNVRYVLKNGDKITLTFPPEQRSEYMKSVEIPLTIVFEDDHFLIIHKPPHLPTIPSRLEPNWSLANGVLFYYDQNDIASTFHAVNRLDRDTSGLVLIAKHRYAHDLLTRQQKSGIVKRSYKALIHGRVPADHGTINAPIGRKPCSIIEREVRSDGQEAITHFRVIHRYNDVTLIELSLETGRTHQIRVHMAHLGYPLLGDDLYGGKRELISRQALHSDRLSFFHPFLEEQLTFSVLLEQDMVDVCCQLEKVE